MHCRPRKAIFLDDLVVGYWRVVLIQRPPVVVAYIAHKVSRLLDANAGVDMDDTAKERVLAGKVRRTQRVVAATH